MQVQIADVSPPSASGAVSIHFDTWRHLVAQAETRDQTEQIVGFGRWWMERSSMQMALSEGAASITGTQPGAVVERFASALRVLPDDIDLLDDALRQVRDGIAEVDCQFRLIDPLAGVRCLRLRSMRPIGPTIATGILIDVTSSMHALLREKFSFALTQHLIGTDTQGAAVTTIIRLVCEDLDWEWGAYWASDAEVSGESLHCQHCWHGDDPSLTPLKQHSESAAMPFQQDLVGQVWRSGKAVWIDGLDDEPDFLRGRLAGACGLQTGYMFPVTFVGPDGDLHRPGVLEFFNKLPRQREAQLPHLSGAIGALIAVTSQRMVQQEHIRKLALYDELTGLANRKHFYSLVDAACREDPGGRPFGLLYIDLDHFKPINDAFGHRAGNEVLAEFGRRLGAIAPSGSLVGRLGGDEFGLLAAPAIARPQLDALGALVLLAASTPFLFGAHELTVSASVGISLFPTHGGTTAELLHAADAAMYRSKRDGGNLIRHYSDDGNQQQAHLAGQLKLLTELHHAQTRDEFFMLYQPIFDAFDNSVVAVEALIRWRKPNGDIVPPDVFIPIAEQSRLIVDLGRWVSRQACRDLQVMHQAGMAGVQVHINMAASEFVDSDLPRTLMEIVRGAGVAPHNICLELTEGVVMRQPEKTIPIMHELRRLGFGISLDDFGMGYSSLSLLKRLPIDSFKIDRLFVGGLPDAREDCAIVRAILELGRTMKIRVIAEGVETDAQLSFLRQFSCLIQGYLLGRPMSVTQLIAQYGNRS